MGGGEEYFLKKILIFSLAMSSPKESFSFPNSKKASLFTLVELVRRDFDIRPRIVCFCNRNEREREKKEKSARMKTGLFFCIEKESASAKLIVKRLGYLSLPTF